MSQRNRVIRLEVVLTTADEVLALRSKIAELQGRLDSLQADYNRVELLYRSECLINLELQDLLKAHRIPYRQAIAQYAGR